VIMEENTPLVNLLLSLPRKGSITTPHTPHLNGTAERLNRMLIEGVHTMLADSKLPHKFW